MNKKQELTRLQDNTNELLSNLNANYRISIRYAYNLAGVDRLKPEDIKNNRSINNLTSLMNYKDCINWLNGFYNGLLYTLD